MTSTREPRARARAGAGRGWRIFGTVFAVVLAVGGLAAIALVVLFVLAMNSWGSNK